MIATVRGWMIGDKRPGTSPKPTQNPASDQSMWPTSTGTRTLTGAEAALVAAGVVVMLDSFDERLSDEDNDDEDEDDRHGPTADMQLGIAVFDSLTIPQRIAMLHHVTQHLLTDAILSAEETSAVDDATIAAIFSEIQDQLTIEIDLHLDEDSAIEFDDDRDDLLRHDALHWRHLILAAFNQTYSPIAKLDDFTIPKSPSDTSLDVWEDLIDALASAILWDRDFELADGFLDEDPISARHRRRLLGIHDDYFVEPPMDPTTSQTRVLLAQARSLASRRPR